ncbi:histidine phosphatase family protein [Vibrio diazotrophicus]|uniref:Alpha-ribazole phosphatase n=1 Tax=Vibrio diazotrophicus TaxID=685 RepID=A0ABX4WBU9_VIBDI|nr:histidine phosphatase family protein [Vibrio diazotrophicus]PNI01487.1 alpha-ribazole phosphatase [Vibrio diazotrophicus]
MSLSQNQFNLYLLRHGKTKGKPALNGHKDVVVDDSIQNAIAHRVLEQYSFSKVYASPLIRCQRVAELVTGLNPTLKLVIEPRLKEQSFGDFDGVPFDDLTHEWKKLEQFWANPAQNTLPNAEPLQVGYERVTEAWEQIVQHCEQDTLIVSHGGPIRFILAHVLGLDWQNPQLYTSLSIDNQSVTHIQISKFAGKVFFSVKAIGIPLI